MDQQPRISDEEIMKSWYSFAAREHGFVGKMLKLLRDRERITPEEQQTVFGINDRGFCRLEAMPMPRPKSLTSDAHRIAEACHLANPFAFVQAIVLASELEKTQKGEGKAEFYQAAFDPENDLDQIPKKD